ncbi:unnamed protein product [Paramecium pentaurelia]|uniref:Uncharacterized protein n=1 Tax=Paramecium pentaurelia TaxID=43138 RepID=A0A8S1YMD2_9CILI|nr:unnamed protein product [Paramecium pentaurelia]
MSSEEHIYYCGLPEKLQLFDFSSLTICPISFSSDVGPIEQIQAIDDNKFIMFSLKKKFLFAIQFQFNKKEREIYFFQHNLFGNIYKNNQIFNYGTHKTKNDQGHRQKINCLNASYVGVIFGTASDDTTIRLWNIDFNESRDPMLLLFPKDGLLVTSGSSDKTIIIWEMYEKQ